MARLEPWPTISTVLPPASADCTAASTSVASRGRRVSAIAGSESRNVGKRDPTRVDVHAPELGASVQRRKYLARVEQTLVVERAFEPLLLLEVGLGEHCRHQVALLHADAMLAGEHPAHLDAKPQDVGAELFRTLEFARLVCVIEDERMEIAVAGMKDIGHGKAVAFRQFAHALEHLRQPRPRDGPVHAVVIRRDAADRWERRLASGPEQETLLLGGRGAAAHGAAGFCDRLDAGNK